MSFSKFSPQQAMFWRDEAEPEPQVPTRVVSSWTDTVLHKAGQQPERGFGGRLHFFGNASDAPVPVDGQLVVFAFDDTGRAAHETQPTRRFIFPAEQFAKHESDSQLGPSYSVWLPWDAVGGDQKNISLIVRFEPTVGSVVLGEQTRHLLPGTTLAENGGLARPETDEPAAVVRAEHVSALDELQPVQPAVARIPAPPVEEKRPLGVTTIALPKRK